MKAAIYTRISSDEGGDRLGVERQRRKCRALARERGWTVAHEFEDDDRSAFSGKPRPEYERMLRMVQAGEVGAVVAYDDDRLHRPRPTELEEFIALVESTGAKVLTVSGELDYATAGGRMLARIKGSVARHEAEKMSERIKMKHDELARAGKPHGGPRSYGYEPGGMKLRSNEARIVREVRDRLFAGESMRSIVRDLNRRGVKAAGGGEWVATNLKRLMISGRIAGLTVSRGEVIGAALWPAIISAEDRDRLIAMLNDPSRTRRGRPPVHLLSGMVRCSLCGGPMRAGGRVQRRDGTSVRTFVCQGNDDGHGQAIKAEALEELVADAVLTRLSSRAFAAIAKRTSSRATATIQHTAAQTVSQFEHRLTELGADYDDGVMSRREYLDRRERLQAKLEAARTQVRPDPHASVLASLSGLQSLETAWDGFDMDRKRAILRALVEYVEVSPATTPTMFGAPVDPERVEVCWRA
jgi:DNA invertase Pin-like site-specific DNA recombinase